MTIRILIVEDEAVVALANAELVARFGYEVVGPVESCEEALEAAEAAEPAMALVDIRIRGDVDGIETATRLRNRFGCAILFVTGQSDRTTRERAESSGPAGYLHKPFTPDQLRQAIEGVLTSHG